MCIKCLLGFVVILPSFFPSSYWWKWSWVNLAHTEWGKGLHSVNHQTGGIFFELSLVSILKLWILFLHPWNVFSFTTFKLPFFLHNNLTTIIFFFGEIVLIFNLKKKKKVLKHGAPGRETYRVQIHLRLCLQISDILLVPFSGKLPRHQVFIKCHASVLLSPWDH